MLNTCMHNTHILYGVSHKYCMYTFRRRPRHVHHPQDMFSAIHMHAIQARYVCTQRESLSQRSMMRTIHTCLYTRTAHNDASNTYMTRFVDTYVLYA